jgi:hypothetical protein
VDLEAATLADIADELCRRYRGVVVLTEGPAAGPADGNVDEFSYARRGGLSMAMGMTARYLRGLRRECDECVDAEDDR